jgi:3-deoxy-D-manno-octulosonic-acid transferase
MRLFSSLYNAGLCLFGCAIFPKILYEKYRSGKYSNLYQKKMGASFEGIQKGDAPLVWIHAVSMGETKAIWKFANLLKDKYPHLQLLITSATDTGHAEAKRSLPNATYHLYLPFDFSWVIRPIVARLKPDLVILSETDHWYNFLQAAKEEGAHVAVINGKLSERSLNRYKWLGPFLSTFFSPIDKFCVQNTLYQDRIAELGIDRSKIAVTGNLKFDASPDTLTKEAKAALKTKLKLKPEDFVIVAGSTHEDEEVLILAAFEKLAAKHPNLKIIFVPRHPERFSRVEKLLQSSSLGLAKFSNIDKATGKERVILIDAMGQLKNCFQLANLAIVCGSFVSHVGGHNILEPSFYGVPVLFGPFMHTQTELTELVLNASAGIQLTRENIGETIEDLLTSEKKLAALSEAGTALSSSLQGTSAKTLDVLEKEFNLSQTFSLVLK